MTNSDHTPTPREHELPTGDLAVSSHWVHGVSGATTVPEAKRPLYRLLMDILEDVWVPDLMPAHLARACTDLVEARETVLDIERGHATVDRVGYGMAYCHHVRDAIREHRDREPIHLVAVGCSGSKHHDDGLMPAAERYKGGYWTNKREYYEAFCDDGGKIISAEHGLLDPETPIEYYERVPGDLEGIPVDSSKRLPNGDAVATLLDQWALEVHEGLAAWLEAVAGGIDPRDVVLEILLGEEKYASRLRKRGVFEALRVRGDLAIRFPFRDQPQAQGGIGNQRSWLCDRRDAAAVATDGGHSE